MQTRAPGADAGSSRAVLRFRHTSCRRGDRGVLLRRRVHGRAHEQFQIPIPRDGGIADLLAEAEAERPDRRFDIVICQSMDRIARRTYIATEIEHRLEMAGVRLMAADESAIPASAGRKGKGVDLFGSTCLVTRVTGAR
ncbi:MAG: hypothetical protein ACRDOI_26260 [Trebonia sp.]